MRIIDLTDDPNRVAQTAGVLFAAFRDWSTGWESLDAAVEEVRESLAPGRISRVAVEDGAVCGWVGGISRYHEQTWELHPLCVAPAVQGRGIGAALVRDFELQIGLRGGGTVYLTSDDSDGRTSLHGTHLYPDVLAQLARLQDTVRHPVGFYLRLGYALSGVIPDAYGPGRHDLILAKRVR
jgi:aminoglycoside 6'-N-acetyltransferase I